MASNIKKDFSEYRDFKISEHSIKYTYGNREYEYILDQYLGNEETVRIPDGVDTLASFAFKGCDSVKEIYVPHSVRKVRSYAFDTCPNLVCIHFEGYYTSFEDSAFWGVPSPLKVTYVGSSTEFTAATNNSTVTHSSYDGGWGGGAPGIYSETYTKNPRAHSLKEDFIMEVYGIKNDTTVKLNGTVAGGKLVGKSTPYDD